MYCLSLVLLTSLLGSEQVLDEFRYADAPAAQAAWSASEGAAPVQVILQNNRPVMQLDAPFASQAKQHRVVVDRKAPLDLNAPGSFLLETAVDDPHNLGYLSLYFRSGNGWYSAGASFKGKGRQTVHFAKSDFRTEGSPAGWKHIDGIRLAVWRSENKNIKDSAIQFYRLAAVSRDVALVIPGKTASNKNNELQMAHDMAKNLATMFDELGIPTDTLDEDAVATGALGKRRAAILAYNPTLNKETIDSLTQFINHGGKLVVCYLLPSKLGDALGFGQTQYVRQKREGNFAEMRFDAADVQGLPKSVRQNSWNITTAKPTGHNARVIGRWFDDAGKATDQPAVLLSDRGAFFSHILLADDPQAKQQLLAAIMGRLVPSLWKQMAQATLDQVWQIGHCTKIEDVLHYFNYAAPNKAVSTTASRGLKKWEEAREQFSQASYVEAIATAHEAHQLLAKAYLHVAIAEIPKSKREGRAVWNHSGTGAFPGDWDRSAKLLADNGFNMILPNMLWGGLAHYASDVLPRSDTFKKYGDQIEQCCAAAKRHGLEVHVWKVNFNLCTASKEFIDRMRREGRTQVTVKGEPSDWLCPSHPANRKLEIDSMLEVASKYPVDGLHFDYIRYPWHEFCYCDGCRERFEADSKQRVENWPKDCFSGNRKEEYIDWRCRQITALVEAVRREARKIRPGIKISAAVFGSYPDCRRSVGQDWPAWIKAGYLDFVCPMDYTTNDAEFTSLVRNQLKLIEGRVPLYPGIGATATGIAMTPDRVAGQIHLARELGAAGYTIFNFDAGTAASIVPGIGIGTAGQQTIPPHKKP